jgi:hypothetical protein
VLQFPGPLFLVLCHLGSFRKPAWSPAFCWGMISENVTLMARRKSCQPGMHPRQGVEFFGEQINWPRCLSECLSGNGQNLLNAPVPAPGGDQ